MIGARTITVAWLLCSVGCVGIIGADGMGGTQAPPGGGMIEVVNPRTALPPAPARLTRIEGVVLNDTVSVTFDALEDAVDYRIYALPADSDVVVGGPTFHVRNAVYRCAGLRTAHRLYNDRETADPFWAPRVLIASEVLGFPRTEAGATLGYVFVEPGEGRQPIYALGDPDLEEPNVFQASRGKRYVTEAERTVLLAQGWRDDGVAFYAPTSVDSTSAVYRVDRPHGSRATLYVSDGAERTFRASASPAEAFRVLPAPTETTQPLMRVYYPDGKGHDELVAGRGAFARIRRQGNQSATLLSYSGLSAPTVLVVEALKSGCPYPGHLSPAALPEERYPNGVRVPNGMVAFETPDELKAKNPYRELFVNGQHDATSEPEVLARSFIRAAPTRIEADWSEDFNDSARLEGFSPPVEIDYAEVETQNEQYDVVMSAAYFGAGTDQLRRWAMGGLFGQLWVTYADNGANGKFRITPKQRFPMRTERYLHVAMETPSVSTSRRYPQVVISDSDWPVRINRAKNGSTVIVQPRETWPHRLEAQICDHRLWDVNCQCPRFEFDGWSSESESWLTHRPPTSVVGERSGLDFPNRYDVYLSRDRLYVFFDRQPFGCAVLAPSTTPAVDATVTFGDVLYHSSAESEILDPGTAYPFHQAHLSSTTRRTFDNLSVSSGVDAPRWDEARFPCQTRAIPDGENCSR